MQRMSLVSLSIATHPSRSNVPERATLSEEYIKSSRGSLKLRNIDLESLLHLISTR
jgi:hypothetical protein